MALGYADVKRMPKAIEFIFSDAVRNQDKVLAFMSIGANHPHVCWNALKENETLFKKMYGHSHLMQRLVDVATGYFVDASMMDEIKTYFEAHKFPGAERTVQQSIETIAINSDWLKRDGESIKQYLSKY